MIEMEDYEMLLHPVMSEKAVRMIESENKIMFLVNPKVNKTNVKYIFEKLYSVKVKKVNMLNDTNGKKRAIIKLDSKYKASELANKLGMI